MDLEDQFGGNQNQRQPLTFLDDNGRTVVGVFTPKRTVNVWENYASVIETLVQNARKEKEKDKMLPPAVQKQLNPFWDLTEQGEKLLLGFMKKLDTPEGAEILGLKKNADRSEKMAAIGKLNEKINLLNKKKEGAFLSSTNSKEHQRMTKALDRIRYKLRLMQGEELPELSEGDRKKLEKMDLADEVRKARYATYEYYRIKPEKLNLEQKETLWQKQNVLPK